uniref:Uncharacterized protein n=1 Tax=Rhizophora mucronata TaxID=61149 RepID=A0A2P2QP98_RHIMU
MMRCLKFLASGSQGFLLSIPWMGSQKLPSPPSSFVPLVSAKPFSKTCF